MENKVFAGFMLKGIVPALLAAFAAAAPAQEPLIVIGQSLGLGPNSDGRGFRVRAGALAEINKINAAGGIHGRKLELVTLDDDDDPKRHAQNMRKLVTEHKAVALLNCVGDASCRGAALVANELRVPLVGALAGTRDLARPQAALAYRIRAGYEKEAQALGRQLRQIGCFTVVVVTESAPSAERIQTLQALLSREKITVGIVQLTKADPAGYEALLSKLAGGSYQAAVMDLSSQTVEAIAAADFHKRAEWPRVLTTMASGNLAALVGTFRNRTLGFTTVVPNPELSSTLLGRELQQDAERFSSGPALTFEGMEGYVGAKVLTEALRRAGRRASSEQLAQTLDTMGTLDLGGYAVSFEKGRSSGSDWVDIGLRSRHGGVLLN